MGAVAALVSLAHSFSAGDPLLVHEFGVVAMKNGWFVEAEQHFRRAIDLCRERDSQV